MSPSDVSGIRRDLATRGVAVVTVDGDCMAPALRDGEMALVTRCSTLRSGEVALLDAGGTLEVHRLGLLAGRWALHKGDASPCWGIAGRDQLLGRVAIPAAPVAGAGWMGLLLQLAAIFWRVGLFHGVRP
jgi:hypothetical protein